MSALDLIQGILDRVQDEGDRVYLGSTNDVELLRHVITVLDAARPLPDHPPTFGGDDVEAVARISETKAEKIARLQREIGARQMVLQYLVLGDPSQGVSGQPNGRTG